jgi:hypothetical protein
MIKIPAGLTGKKLLDFIVANKASLIKQKCAFPIKSDPNGYPYTVKKSSIKTDATKAGDQSVVIDDNNELNIVAIANAANWIDSQMDMLLPDCWKKTIKESGPQGKNRIYHLKNHMQNTDGVIGRPTALYSQDYSLTDLGIDKVGTTQCLVMESAVMESLDDKCYDMYVAKMINQHSIGLQYVKLDLAVNDPNFPAEFDIWNKYFAQAINKDIATSCGYFWVVYEIKLLEVSAVLWGANELTPCIDEDDEEDMMGKSQEKTVSVSDLISKTQIKL